MTRRFDPAPAFSPLARVVDPLDLMVRITPHSLVARDVSFVRTGPDLAPPG